MVRENEVRLGEKTIEAPPAQDAGLVFIGQIRTPWNSRMETPRQGRRDGPICRIEIFEPWVEGLENIEEFEELEVLYWLHMSRRDLVLQSPASDGKTRGVFRCALPCVPILSGPPSSAWLVVRAARFWFVAWIVSMALRCSTLSRNGHASRLSPRRSLATLK